MSRTRKNKIFTLPRLIIYALILMLAVFGLWMLLRAAIVKGVTAGIQDAEHQGYQIGHGGLSITGFPLKISAHSDDISIRAPTSSGNDPSKNWAITLDQLTAKSATLTPLSWAVTHSGTARIDMRSPVGERYMFDIDPAHANVNARMGIGGTLKTAHFDVGTIRLTPLVGSQPALIGLATADADLTTIDTEAHIVFNTRNVVLSDKTMGVLKQVMGTNLENLNVKAVIHDWPMLEKQGAEYWQNKDGHFTISQANVKWGQVDIASDMDFSFVNGTPEGILNLRIKNPLELIKNLANSGAINMTPVMISQLSRLLDELEVDENGRTELELSFKNHQIKYGFLPLGSY